METSASFLGFVGPIAEAFVADRRIITGIMGPYGSGKTTTCIRKIVESLFWQNPGPDGVRRARWCVVRDTYQQLETNVLNSWFTWFPKTKENWNGRQMKHTLRWEVVLLDGQPAQVVELEVYFRAMGDQKAEDVLKGLELTGLWLNETDTLDKSVLRFGLPRCGRYPPAKLGGCQWSGVICDFNAPDIDNWTYNLFVEQDMGLDSEAQETLRAEVGDRFGVGFHQQPGGRSKNPPPENASSYSQGIDAYYAGMMAGMSQADIRRFVDNEFGAVRNGQPVYPEFNDALHTARDVLMPRESLPVCIGIDAGGTPAAVFGDIDDHNRIRWLDELVAFSDDEDAVLERMGPQAFGEALGDVWLAQFARCQFGGAWVDPAALYGDNEDAYSWVKIMWDAFRKRVGSAATAWKIKPAPCKGNRLPERLEAVRKPLTQMVAGQPQFQLSKVCKVLRRGFNNAYVIMRVQLSGGHGRYQDKPLKNDESHVHDAGQYLNLGMLKRGAQALGVRETRRDRRGGNHRARVNFGSGPFAHHPR